MKAAKRTEAIFELIRVLVALAIAYVITLACIFFVCEDPVKAVYYFAVGPFTTKLRFGQMMGKMIPYLLTGTGMCFVYAANRFNLIGEGVYSLSAVMAVTFALKLDGFGIPHVLMIALLLIIGTLVGGAVSYVPSVMREKLNVHEVVSSIMINSSVLYITTYIVKAKIGDKSLTYLGSMKIPLNAKLTALVKGTNFHSGIFIGLAFVLVAWVILYRTPLGHDIRVSGSNAEFAKTIGIDVTRSMIIAQTIGGMYCALGGAIDILGVYERYMWTGLTQMGMDGLLVAVLSKKKPQYVPLGAFLLAYMKTGATILNYKTDIPLEFVQVMQAIIILLIAAEHFLGGAKEKVIFSMARKAEKESAQ